MWTFFFIIALIGIIMLLFHLMLQLNEFEKQVTTLTEKLKKHYESE